MIPYTDHECRLALEELYRGDKVVLPSSYEHAVFMLRVAQNYIAEQHQATFDALKKDYTK
jgi:hypothetical protein